MASDIGGAGVDPKDTVILEEDFDPDYDPSEEDVLEYATFLGMDLEEDKDLFWLAKEGLKAPLPPEWKPCKSEDQEIYYFNFKTGESEWEHPCDKFYKEEFQKKKAEKLRKLQEQQNQRIREQELTTSDNNTATAPAAKTRRGSADSTSSHKRSDIPKSDSASSRGPLGPLAPISTGSRNSLKPKALPSLDVGKSTANPLDAELGFSSHGSSPSSAGLASVGGSRPTSTTSQQAMGATSKKTPLGGGFPSGPGGAPPSQGKSSTFSFPSSQTPTLQEMLQANSSASASASATASATAADNPSAGGAGSMRSVAKVNTDKASLGVGKSAPVASGGSVGAGGSVGPGGSMGPGGGGDVGPELGIEREMEHEMNMLRLRKTREEEWENERKALEDRFVKRREKWLEEREREFDQWKEEQTRSMEEQRTVWETALRKQLAKEKEEIERDEHNNARKFREELRAELQSQDEELESERTKLQAKKDSLQKQQTDLERQEADMRARRKELEAQQDEVAEQKAALADLVEQLDTQKMQQEIEIDVEKQKAERAIERIRQKAEESKKKLEQEEDQTESLRKTLFSSREALAREEAESKSQLEALRLKITQQKEEEKQLSAKVEQLKEQVEDLSKDQSAEATKQQETQRELAQLAADKAQAEEERDMAQLEVKRLALEVDRLQQQVEAECAERNKVVQQLKEKQKRLVTLEAQVSKSDDVEQRLQKSLRESQEQTHRQKQRVLDLEMELGSAQTLSSTRGDVEQKLRDTVQQLRDLKAQEAEASDRAQGLEQDLAQTQQLLKSKQEQLGKERARAAKAEVQVDSLESALEEVRSELNNTQRKLEAARSAQQQAVSRCEELTTQVEELGSQIQEKDQAIDELSQKLRATANNSAKSAPLTVDMLAGADRASDDERVPRKHDTEHTNGHTTAESSPVRWATRRSKRGRVQAAPAMDDDATSVTDASATLSPLPPYRSRNDGRYRSSHSGTRRSKRSSTTRGGSQSRAKAEQQIVSKIKSYVKQQRRAIRDLQDELRDGQRAWRAKKEDIQERHKQQRAMRSSGSDAKSNDAQQLEFEIEKLKHEKRRLDAWASQLNADVQQLKEIERWIRRQELKMHRGGKALGDLDSEDSPNQASHSKFGRSTRSRMGSTWRGSEIDAARPPLMPTSVNISSRFSDVRSKMNVLSGMLQQWSHQNDNLRGALSLHRSQGAPTLPSGASTLPYSGRASAGAVSGLAASTASYLPSASTGKQKDVVIRISLDGTSSVS